MEDSGIRCESCIEFVGWDLGGLLESGRRWHGMRTISKELVMLHRRV